MKSVEEQEQNFEQDPIWNLVMKNVSLPAACSDNVTIDTSNNLQIQLHDIPHFRQRESWDCGIACLVMFFSFLKKISTF